MVRRIPHSHFKEGRIPLKIMPYLCQNDVGFHQHSFSELVIILAGDGIHFTDNEEYAIMAGDVFFVNTSQGHGYRNTESLSLINVLFDWEQLQLPWCDLRDIPGYHGLFTIEPKYRGRHNFMSRLRLNMRDLKKAQLMCEAVGEEMDSDLPGRDFVAVARFAELVAFLSRCYSDTQMPMSRPVLRLGRVFSYIETHYAEEVTLDDLAEMAHMSKSSLRRAFLDSTGRAPIDYLIRTRIKHSASLLQQTDMDISAIAFEVGFTDSNYYSRQFRRVRGCSPREFRQRQNR